MIWALSSSWNAEASSSQTTCAGLDVRALGQDGDDPGRAGLLFVHHPAAAAAASASSAAAAPVRLVRRHPLLRPSRTRSPALFAVVVVELFVTGFKGMWGVTMYEKLRIIGLPEAGAGAAGAGAGRRR